MRSGYLLDIFLHFGDYEKGPLIAEKDDICGVSRIRKMEGKLNLREPSNIVTYSWLNMLEEAKHFPASHTESFRVDV